MNWEEYLSNASYMADLQARREFGSKLMLAFKQKNLAEGIQWYQAVHLHGRMRDWQVVMPPALLAALGGVPDPALRVDMVNIIVAGDIETASLALTYGVADPMTSPFHWISQERIDWMNTQLKSWLGWV
jgi:hypothetical protein